MITLDTLKNTSRPKKNVKRVGRGLGSGLGKTCGRGEKGAGSRSGYKRRHTYEGGQFRLFMKVPFKGFNNKVFTIRYETINLDQITQIFSDNEVVNAETLFERGYLAKPKARLKVLGNGELGKKVTIQANAFSKSAEEKLTQAKAKFEVVQK